MPGVSVDTIIAVGWALCGLCTVTTGVRYALRGLVIRSWYWDDLAHGVALILFIAFMAAFTAARPVVNAVSNNDVQDPDLFRIYLQYNTSITIVSWTCFFAVKIAFLLFYKMLFKTKKWFLWAWWGVLTYVVLAYWVIIAATLTWCGAKAAWLLDEEICTSAYAMGLDRKDFIYSYVLNVSSDLAVMALPLMCVSTIQISNERKIGLSLLFCLGFVIIAFDSLRLSQSVGTVTGADNILWSALEAAVSVLVSCMPTFAALKRWKANGYRSSPRYGYPLRAHPEQTHQAHQTHTERTASYTNTANGSSIKASSVPEEVKEPHVKE